MLNSKGAPRRALQQRDGGKSIADLIRLSRAIGSDLRLVQAGGGNTSVKDPASGLMWVKASGTALRDMKPGLGYRAVRLDTVLEILSDRQLAAMPVVAREREVVCRLLAACADDLPGRPSVETCLHAFLGRCVVHAHPVMANGLACAKEGEKAIAHLFGGRAKPPLFVPYTDPGLLLARRTQRAVSRYRKEHGTLPEIIFLANHGLFVSAGSVKEAVRLTREVDQAASRLFSRLSPEISSGSVPLPPRRRRALAQRVMEAVRTAATLQLGKDVKVSWNYGREVRRFLAHPRAAFLARMGPLTPDQVVYAHGGPIWIADPSSASLVAEIRRAMEQRAVRLGEAPRCVLAKEVGLFTMSDEERLRASAEAITVASLTTLLVADLFGGPRPLTPRAIRYIAEWECELFRRAVAKGQSS